MTVGFAEVSVQGRGDDAVHCCMVSCFGWSDDLGDSTWMVMDKCLSV